MKRLIEDMGVNSPQEYDRIYEVRKQAGPDSFDVKRWKLLLKYYRGGKLIDLGCLDSLVPEIAHGWYPKEEIWGLDVAKEAIDDMRRRYPYLYWQTGDVYDNKFPDNYFTYATAGELIEHLDDPEKFFAETFRTLKRGGILALSTPLGETTLGEVDNHRHIWSWEEEDMHHLLEPYGTVRIKVMGSTYFPYSYHYPSMVVYCKKYI